MQSPCIREASKACCHGCCPAPFMGLPDQLQNPPPNSTTGVTATTPQYDFHAATVSSLHPHSQFTNHESLPSLGELFFNFNKSYPQYSQTILADQIRAQEYYHLSQSNHVCLDYVGNGLFSYSQQQFHPSSSSSSLSSNVPFFDILYKSVSLNSQILYGGEESEFESKIRKRIMGFMNISEDDYSTVFTANKSSAFKLLADSYPFHSNRNLVTIYDYESEAVEAMIKSAMNRGTCVMSAEFSWPSLRIHTRKLRKMVVSKRKKKKMGLFVFPPQSSMTGARYPFQWMSMAQENGWHVLLDATALGAKDMETLGLSLFQPDFLICSFFKIFGENPSGLACLFIKKSSASVFTTSNIATSRGIVSLVPRQSSTIELPKEDLPGPSSSSTSINLHQSEDDISEIQEIQESEELSRKHKKLSVSEILKVDNRPLNSAQSRSSEMGISGSSELECRGLDHADSLGLILISSRARYLVNWLVNALMSLQHPHSENGLPLLRIYGPKVRIKRGPAVAFNVFDWKGEKLDPKLVQKLADRNNISLSCGFLHHLWFSDKYEEEREKQLEKRKDEQETTVGNKRKQSFHTGIYVLTASIGFLTNFEDMYRLWAFVSRFLDADFVEKERWRYMALNQTTIEV
ncbi:Molybdenum cofactor sulfurase [Camellia lanceoleosa]|uniref:Molybdenum cofactor sulfurase n=1 Tax=Camellia lanceoleosa TaxID=1840588 RepID=A0ACC0FME3_9ERIC|nr:Molybdenum cofactor sulfurase [Camellia lanceoleosa]